MRVLVAAVMLVAVAAAAQAQTGARRPANNASTANITGYWAFETDTYSNGCKMTGVMTIRPDARGNHVCSIETNEKCTDIEVRAKETCFAKHAVVDLLVTSTVTSGAPEVGYEPDDFELKIQNSSYMTGMMKSFNSAPVRFFRGDAPVS